MFLKKETPHFMHNNRWFQKHTHSTYEITQKKKKDNSWDPRTWYEYTSRMQYRLSFTSPIWNQIWFVPSHLKFQQQCWWKINITIDSWLTLTFAIVNSFYSLASSLWGRCLHMKNTLILQGTRSFLFVSNIDSLIDVPLKKHKLRLNKADFLLHGLHYDNPPILPGRKHTIG